jgi:NADH:ubiquinone oxidoreductase subunit E/formylmethanofuran dehydrogenase subunit D
VQGACDLGALPIVYSGYQKVADPKAREKMEKAWNTDVPADPGLTVVEIMNAAEEGKVKGVYIIGENPMVSDPDLNHTEQCLKKLDFLVVQDIFLTETARLADVVLPSLCFAEKEGTFTNTERKVLRVRKAVEGPGEARPDWAITSDIASRMGYEMAYEDAQAIMEEIASVTPSYGGISYERIEKDGLHWPCPDREHPGTPLLHVGKFTHGMGKFHSVKFVAPAETTDDEYPVTLTTGRMLYHYHTGTMTMKSEGLNDRAPWCFVEMSGKDAGKYGIEQGSWVKIASRRGEITAEAHVSDTIMEGTVFIPFHFARNAANRLTNAALDPVCKIPELKVCAVRLTPTSEKPEVRHKWGQLDIKQNVKEIIDRFCRFLEEAKAADRKEAIDSILRSNRNSPGAIIPVLQQVQEILGYLPPVVQNYIALGMNLPASSVCGIVTFYAFFTQVPRGKYILKVCLGTACYVMGANEITTRFEELLNVKVGGTTEDREFSLETVRCLGCCGIAPVIMVNDDTHGNMAPNKCQAIIDRYREIVEQEVMQEK